MLNKKTKILIFLFIISSLLWGWDNFAFSQEKTNAEVKELNSEIQERKNKIEEIQEKQKVYTRNIRQKQKEQASLNNQLSLIDNRLAKAELDIESIETEIKKTNLEIRKVDLEIETKNQEIKEEKKHIAQILKLMYKEDQVNTLEIILLNDSLSQFLNQVKYLEDVNEEVSESLEDLKSYKKGLEKDLKNLDEKKQEMFSLKERLGEKKGSLEDEKNSKYFILDQVKESESEYQRLLSLAKKEQANAAADIASLEKRVRAKVNDLSGGKLEFNDAGMIWPVSKNTITSYFHDPEYPFRYIFEHPAIDIRAGQGTTLKAAASGYVARVKISGTNYGYIMLVHGDGLSTVYGHASKSFVTEDEYIVQGQSIGLSGGMPGTPGAGRLTTGPHLHFEVRLNGIPVNPLEYLP